MIFLGMFNAVYLAIGLMELAIPVLAVILFVWGCIKRNKAMLITSLAISFLVFCYSSWERNSGNIVSTERVAGNYLHTYKSGAIEEWQISSNYFFVQNLYPDRNAYHDKKPKYTLHGKWYIDDLKYNVIGFSEIYLFDFFMKSDSPDEVKPPRKEPWRVTGIKVIWVSGGKSQKPCLILDDEMNYWFLKEDNFQDASNVKSK